MREVDTNVADLGGRIRCSELRRVSEAVYSLCERNPRNYSLSGHENRSPGLFGLVSRGRTSTSLPT